MTYQVGDNVDVLVPVRVMNRDVWIWSEVMRVEEPGLYRVKFIGELELDGFTFEQATVRERRLRPHQEERG